jgi:hypothetical protein
MPTAKIKQLDINKMLPLSPTLKLTGVSVETTYEVSGTAFVKLPGGLIHPAAKTVRMITVLFVTECCAESQLDARITVAGRNVNPNGMTLTTNPAFETRSVSGWIENIPAGDIEIAVECKGNGKVRNRNLSIWIYE